MFLFTSLGLRPPSRAVGFPAAATGRPFCPRLPACRAAAGTAMRRRCRPLSRMRGPRSIVRACVRACGCWCWGARRRATPGFCAVSRRRRRSRATSTRTRASARSPSPPPPASSRCPPSPAPRPASTGSRARALPPGLLGQAPGPAAYRRAQPTRRLREVGAGNIGRGAGAQKASARHHSLQAGPSPPPPRQGVRLLLEAQADPGGRDVGTGATSLMAAARTGRADVAEALLAACADPAARDESGRTALAVAAGEEVRLVLERVTPASARAAAGGGSRACFVS